MGCIADTPARVGATKLKGKDTPAQSPTMLQSPNLNDDTNILRSDIMQLLQSISQLPKPDQTGPVVCFGGISLPLIVAPLSLEEGDSIGVTLPVIAISHHDCGRACVIGSTNILLYCTKENPDGSAFFEALIKWASGISRGRVTITILGYSKVDTEQMQRNLSGVGFRIYCQPIKLTSMQQLQQSQVIICPSDFEDKTGFLIDFVQNNNGGLICTLQPPKSSNYPNRYAMNSTLCFLGLGFPQTALIVGPVNTPNLTVTPSYTSLSKYTFTSLSERLKTVLQKPEIDITELDACVTAVRYNVFCMPQSINENLMDLYKMLYDYLKTHNYETNEGYCPELSQSVLSVLVCEIQAKLAAACFAGQDLSERFPGKASEEPDQDDVATIHLDLHKEGWISTGYWLTAGSVATVTVEQIQTPKETITADMMIHKEEVEQLEEGFPQTDYLQQIPPLVLQVGMHTEALYTKECPWKRWPVITNTFDLREVTEIANPFGGMIYIVLSNHSDTPFSIDLKMDHVFPFPRFDINDPQVWEETRDRGAPWAEVKTRFVTFVAPSRTVRAAKDLTQTANLIDTMVSNVLKLLSDKCSHNFLCVFDIELIEGPICGYPIILPLDATEPLLNDTQPSEALFLLTTFIAMWSLPDGTFDPEKESLLATTAACAAFVEMWPNVSPLEYYKDMLPPQFDQLWVAYKKDNGRSFTQAMAKIRMRTDKKLTKRNQMSSKANILNSVQIQQQKDQIDQNDEENINFWDVFIKEVANLSNLNLDSLLDGKKVKPPKPTDVVSPVSSASLRTFKILDDI